ncbi:Forkhead-associated domain containing protein 1 [Dissostichus eleginoides]|uniref:Forkhead-associated domain containing protein 1 n=1 Tax=Dissostichus eleginoides TaxID=100907 RepID=A0AAD9C4U3_DISEL|nr:Forkhead-associated domain containing protein 1 [Dissostichus eleginoides]
MVLRDGLECLSRTENSDGDRASPLPLDEGNADPMLLSPRSPLPDSFRPLPLGPHRDVLPAPTPVLNAAPPQLSPVPPPVLPAVRPPAPHVVPAPALLAPPPMFPVATPPTLHVAQPLATYATPLPAYPPANLAPVSHHPAPASATTYQAQFPVSYPDPKHPLKKPIIQDLDETLIHPGVNGRIMTAATHANGRTYILPVARLVQLPKLEDEEVGDPPTWVTFLP